jgi:hypothetical protein
MGADMRIALSPREFTCLEIEKYGRSKSVNCGMYIRVFVLCEADFFRIKLKSLDFRRIFRPQHENVNVYTPTPPPPKKKKLTL